MALATDVADLRRLARRRLPGFVFDYLDGGGYEEETLHRNRRDLDAITFLPKVLNDVSNRTLDSNLVGTSAVMPVLLAPVGGEGLFYPNGECHSARVAAEFGVPFCLSTLSLCTVEEVAKASSKPIWFQLYLTKDRGVSRSLIERAKAAGCSTMVVSMDIHVRSRRHREEKGGLVAPPRITFKNVTQALLKPGWTFPMLLSRHWTFGNLKEVSKECSNVFSATIWLEDQWDPTIGIRDIEWVKSQWPGKLVIKGLLHPDDAVACANAGADAVVISNHGGRQVDSAVSTVSVLPAVVEAVQGRIPVLVDSGIRSGMDVLKMMAKGASGCLIGRAFAYGLAAGGEGGVRKALEIIKGELDETMALCGARNVHNLPEDLIAFDCQSLKMAPPSSPTRNIYANK